MRERIDDDYEILELIRTGASGNIYRARQQSLNRDVAVTLLDARDTDAAHLRSFLDQIQRLATLNHPNVIQVYQLGTSHGNPFIVTEPISEQLLSTAIAGSGLAFDKRLEIMIGVARGLQAIHALGIVHRNLSPSCISIDMTPKIFDLGLAKQREQITYESQEKQGALTADYLAPEQIEDGPVTPATDIFAFGVMLYEALSNVRPFQAEHFMSVLLRILHDTPAPLASHIASLPPSLSDLVMRCLEKDPAARPQSMAVLADALSAIAAKAPLAAASMLSSGVRSGREFGSGPNPYINAAMIRTREQFFGRKQEVRWIYERLNANPPGSVSIVGDRKIGKSSLLNYIYMQANRKTYLRDPDKTVMVFMNLQGRSEMTIELFSADLLNMAALELGDSSLSISDCKHELDGIRLMVERLDRAGYRLVVILDEFECITNNPNFPVEFFSFMRFLVNNYNVAYITSSLRDLQGLCHSHEISDSPFFNVFSTRRLGAFLPEEARELVRVPSARVGRPLEPYAEQILALAGRFPFFVTLACCCALETLRNGQNLDGAALQRFFQQEARPHFQDLWEEFPTPEQEVLQRVATGRKIPAELRFAQEELEAQGYIERAESGPCIFAPTFQEFVIRSAQLAHPPKSGNRPWLPIVGGVAAAAAAAVAAMLVIHGGDPRRDESRGFKPQPALQAGKMLPTYGKSYALVIGESKYAHWDALRGVEQDVSEVAAVLEEYGFEVQVAENADGAGLEHAFKEFIDRCGRHADDRLLVYFAGHGYTMPQLYGGEMGYIVPVDAPDPGREPEEFRARAMSMAKVKVYALDIQSKHALFVFDACFAGTVFSPLREAPPSIRFGTSRPVRQFITSGTADEKVPDQSAFRKWFVAGLRGDADLNKDDYVTAYELAGFLRTRVSDELNGGQNPQYGVLPEAKDGDVVFSLADLRRAQSR